ncbi:ankyrin repeat-containing domain protein [Nemania serpens]|nr:ankyrin repeat-containing domain protein [Nemania serpens]
MIEYKLFPPPLSAIRFFINADKALSVARYLELTRLDINTIFHNTYDCGTALYQAVKAGADSVVSLLLQAGANHSWPHRGFSPLESAMKHDRVHITRLLLDDGGIQKYLEQRGERFGVPANQKPTDQNEQLLNFIVDIVKLDKKASVEMVKLLLSYCSNLDQLDNRGRTILHRVCRQEADQKKVRAIIQAGVTIDTLTYGEASHGRLEFRTPLNDACRNFHPNIIRALLRGGAAIQGASAFDITGMKADSQVPVIYATPTPLFDMLYGMNGLLFYNQHNPDPLDTDRWEVNKRCILKCIKILIDQGLSEDQGMFDEHHNVLFDIPFACARLRVDSEDLWTLLSEGGVLDVHRRDKFGQTFLAQLVSRCFGENLLHRPYTKHNLLRALIAAGSDPNTVDNSGNTPLYWAVFYSDIDIINILLEGGSDPNKKVNGATPVHHAFGKPFDRQGPVMKKVMASLRGRLPKVLRMPYSEDLNEPGRLQAFSQYRNRKWHPLLSLVGPDYTAEAVDAVGTRAKANVPNHSFALAVCRSRQGRRRTYSAGDRCQRRDTQGE